MYVNFFCPFYQDIPDDTVPVTAFLKELLNLATRDENIDKIQINQ